LDKFSKIAEVAPMFWLLFSALKITHVFLAKMGWATVWAILSQTHLVTLIISFLGVGARGTRRWEVAFIVEK
jgi:hypothetical protein